VRRDGTLWAWGWNGAGQLGTGDRTDHLVGPVQVGTGTGTGWRSVAVGFLHTVALREDGTLWAWGYNFDGQLGTGPGSGPGGGHLTPTRVGSDSDWAAVAAGDRHTLALREDGSLWAWGSNDSGQLGTGGFAPAGTPVEVASGTTWTAMSAGNLHSLAVRDDGTLWAWGDNGFGQLGSGASERGYEGTPVQVGVASTWRTASAGAEHSAAIRADGTLWAWGHNTGRLGDGTRDDRSTPVPVGTDASWSTVSAGHHQTVGVRTDGTLWAWGANTRGELGIGDQLGTVRWSPTRVGTDTGWDSLAAGFETTFGVRTDATLWAAGANEAGQLGVINRMPGEALFGYPDRSVESPVEVRTGYWLTVDAGRDHTVGVRFDGTLWAWGRNDHGQLGDGTTDDRRSPVQIGTDSNWRAVAAGGSHSLAIRTDDTLWAWGKNGNGQLGDGTTGDRHTPVRVGADHDWYTVSAGAAHSVGIVFVDNINDSNLYAWGYNALGQLGDDSRIDRHEPVSVSGGDISMLVVAVSAGDFHTVAVRLYGIWTWGWNHYGQLGIGTTDDSPFQQQVTHDGPLQLDGTVISAGGSHTVAMIGSSIYTWGNNSFGQLGDGTTVDRLLPMAPTDATNWRSIDAGGNHTVATTDHGSLWAWGNNSYGQLGDGTTSPRNAPTRIGDATHWASVSAGGNHTVSW
jgi:alpha-tubulin suppressor-like RCC1 family protein